LPPTLHKSGGRYETIVDAEPAPLPEGLLEFIEEKVGKAQGALRVLGAGNDGAPVLNVPPQSLPSPALGANIVTGVFDKPLPSVEVMREMLTHLNERGFFTKRDGIEKDEAGHIVAVGWRECGMALKPAYGDEVGFDLWSIIHVDDRARNDAPKQWESFHADARPGDVTIGTIIKAARQSGFPMPGALNGEVAGQEVNLSDFNNAAGDIKNGQIFAKMYRDRILFIHETGEILAFKQEAGWIASDPGTADRGAKAVVAKLRAEAARCYAGAPEDRRTPKLMAHAAYSSKAMNLRAMVQLARSEDGMTKQLHEFDADPWVLGVRNGVLDLAKGMLLPVTPELLVSKRCNVAYDPNATCPQFLKFLKEVQPDAEIRGFLQRWAGYSLTGEVGEKKFLVFTGEGDNGKTVLVELIGWLLGDYSNRIPTEMLMVHKKNVQAPSPEIVGLKGRRFVFASEVEEGQHLSAARVKDLTGGDTLTGRVPYGIEAITFAPTHKLAISGNYKPEISDNSGNCSRPFRLC
jgi:hypothetical protein